MRELESHIKTKTDHYTGKYNGIINSKQKYQTENKNSVICYKIQIIWQFASHLSSQSLKQYEVHYCSLAL